jgi:alpha-N-arabinofuranosidase
MDHLSLMPTLASILVCAFGAFLAAPALAGPSGSSDLQATFNNPILPGFNPDPGFLRVGDDYYIVTSSFEYFPCFPVYHSKDLVHWKLIGNVLNRPSQIDLDMVAPSDGVFSPVMRYHDGVYYLTYTMLNNTPEQHITNWIVTAKEPGGPWSEPVAVTSDSFWRIDTSLFFDDDGKCYFTANSKGASSDQRIIQLQEIDLKTFKLVGEKHDISSKAFPLAKMAEGAHLYKRDGYYYLLIAEGGTGFGHAVSIGRSRVLTGPYEPCPDNPLLTHRDLPRADAKIYGVGHGELVQAQGGEWYMALLGTRGAGVLGRETFLVPARWDTGQWPVIEGKVQPVLRRPALAEFKEEAPVERQEFDQPELSPDWLTIRVPSERFWSLAERPGYLRIKLKPSTFNEPEKTGTPAFISQRLTYHHGWVMTKMDFMPANQYEVAGLLLRRGGNAISICEEINDSGALTVEAAVESREGKKVVGRAVVNKGTIYLKAECKDEVWWTISCSTDGSAWTSVAENLDGRLLGRDAPGGVYTGTTVGLYASSQGSPSENRADFAFFESHQIQP